MKKLFIAVLTIIFSVSISIPVFAVEPPTEETVGNGLLVIVDPNTREQWNWDLPVSSTTAPNQAQLTSSNSGQIKSADVTVDISEYLARTMTDPLDVEKVLHEDIDITVGLRYSADEDTNTVSIYRAYGSAPDKGMYYAVDKEFYYSNPSVFATVKQTPTSTSWSYTTDSRPGPYFGQLPPHSLLDCNITVRGMESSHRFVSVLFTLDL